MVERLKEGVKENGDLLAKAVFALADVVLGLLVYVYTTEIGELKDTLKGLDTRLVRTEQTMAERGERIRAVEDATTHLNSDMGRIGHELEALNQKLDRLIEQTMRPPVPRTTLHL